VNADLANNLEEVSHKIEAASLSRVSGVVVQPESPKSAEEWMSAMEEVSRNHRANVAKWEELLDEIHALPGFEEFLKPPRFSILRKASRDHAVVAINISSRRCDALVIFSSRPIKHIPLTHLTLDIIEQLLQRFTRCLDSNDLRSRRNVRKTKYDRLPSGPDDLKTILGDLWKLIVSPIWEEIKEFVST
jgi:hypothetical protein